jgi:hypothetical protein
VSDFFGMHVSRADDPSRGLGFLWTPDWGSMAVRRRCPDEQIETA